MREDELIGQMIRLMDEIDFNQILMKDKFDREVERLQKFQRSFMLTGEIKTESNLDIRSYAKYILREGALTEKRELLLCIKSKFVLSQKVLTLASQES
jgi:hypothetical protein